MGLLSETRGRKSIIVQTVQGLREYQLRTEYALRLKRKLKRLDIGWREIARKSFVQSISLTLGQFTTLPQYSPPVHPMLAIGSGHG
jgi:hypothetical protein